MHTSVDNTANGLRYEIMFQNRVNKKKNFFIKQNIAFIFETKIYFIHGDIFFKIPRDLIAPAFFFFFFFLGEPDTKKQRYASPKASNAV